MNGYRKLDVFIQSLIYILIIVICEVCRAFGEKPFNLGLVVALAVSTYLFTVISAVLLRFNRSYRSVLAVGLANCLVLCSLFVYLTAFMELNVWLLCTASTLSRICFAKKIEEAKK